MDGLCTANLKKRGAMSPDFFIDKTHTDVQGKLSLEPVCFTLGIFNRKTRNQAHAWRTIGYVPNFDLLSKYKIKKTEEKVQDYHHMLSIIFNDVYISQKRNGIPWKLFGMDCSLKIPVFSFLGDTEGHDKLVGRLGSRNMVPTICRYCDCKRESSSNEKLVSNYIKQESIKKGGSILKDLGYYKIKNACHELDYCDPERGIHGATPGEIVHVFQHGIMAYILNAFFRMKANTAEDLNPKKQRSQSQLEIYEDTDDDAKTRRNVFSEDVAAEFEERAKKTGKFLRRQSERDLPRTYFSQGILPSKMKQKKDSKKLAAHEQSGVLVNCLFMLFNHGFLHRHLRKKLTDMRMASWVSLLEKMLLFENLLRTELISVEELKLMKEYIPMLMDLIKRVVKRRTGAKWNIVKFHLLLHITDDIERNGVYENVSTGTCESHHKNSAKNPAKNTQRISGVFHEQVGKQYASNVLIDIYSRCTTKRREKEKDPHLEPLFQGQTFQFINKDDDFTGFFNNQENKAIKFSDEKIENDCTNFLTTICDGHGATNFPCYTICKFKNWYCRANPCYRNESWHDWIFFETEEKKRIAVQLLFFVEIKNIDVTVCTQSEMQDRKKRKEHYLKFVKGQSDIYAFVHFLPNPLTEKPTQKEWGHNQKAHQQSLLFEYSRKRCNKTTASIQLITMERMVSTCIAAPDLDAYHEKLTGYKHHCFIFMKRREEWNSIFFQEMKIALMNKRKNEESSSDQNDESNSDDEAEEESEEENESDHDDKTNGDDEDDEESDQESVSENTSDGEEDSDSGRSS